MAKIAFVCTGSEGRHVWPTFILASASAALGDEVIIFFHPGAAPLLEPDVLEEMEAKGMPPMKELLEGFKKLGGRMMLCALTIEALHIEDGDLRDDLEVVGATTFLVETADAARTFTF
jgi:predicted peroxiredoxin